MSTTLKPAQTRRSLTECRLQSLFVGKKTKASYQPCRQSLNALQMVYICQANCPYLKKDITHLERTQRAATRWVKGLRGLTYEERLQALKLQPLGKKRLRNDLVLTHKILYNHIDLDAIVQVLQKARTKMIINKTALSNRENPQKTKQGC